MLEHLLFSWSIQKYHKNVDVNYYKKSLNTILELENKKLSDYNILLFTDNREHAQRLLKNIDINATYVSSDDNIRDFIFMSMCTHNIIGNSTYSWWAAYLNKNEIYFTKQAADTLIVEIYRRISPWFLSAWTGIVVLNLAADRKH